VNWVEVTPSGWGVHCWADVAHLAAALDELPDA
jgi:hypothetical protein